MKGRVYDLVIGESLTVYGNDKLYGIAFTVESIINDTAICVSQDGSSRLIIPLNVGLPFAVQVFARDMKPAIPEKESVQAASFQTNEPEETKEPKRIESTIDFFMPKENWGKLHVDGYVKGIFFHITQVEDDALRKYLATLPAGAKVPKIKVSYLRCCNTGRNNALCAGAIRAEEPLQEGAPEAEPEEAHDGYLVEMACNGTLTILDGENSHEYRTKLKTAVDPYLKAYLDNHAGFGNLDGQGIKVHCFLRGRNLTKVEWSNRDEILSEKEISLDEAVDPEALEKWNHPEKEEEAAEERPVPDYQELPVWKSMRR